MKNGEGIIAATHCTTSIALKRRLPIAMLVESVKNREDIIALLVESVKNREDIIAHSQSLGEEAKEDCQFQCWWNQLRLLEEIRAATIAHPSVLGEPFEIE